MTPRGAAGEPAPGSGVAPPDLGRVREAELRAAAAVVGVAHVELLDLRDSGMAGTPATGTLAATPIEDLTATLAAVIERHRPHLVITLDGSDGHRDHVHVRDPDSPYLDVDEAGLGTPDGDITTILDTSAHLDQRRRAIACHASQVSPFADLPADLEHAFLASDHLRRVRPEAPAGTRETQLYARPSATAG